MELIASSVLNLLAEHRYIFAFLGALFEGTYIMILAGVLYKFGYFKFWGLIGVLGLGYFLNGVIYYLIGRFSGPQVLYKWGNKFHITRRLVEKLERYFKKHSIKTLFITRITYGLSILTLLLAGGFRMKWKKFIIVTLIATVVWIFVMLAVGYVFGMSYEAMGSIAEKIAKGLAILLFAIIISISIFLIVWVQRIIKTRFVKKLENNRFSFLRRVGKVVNNLFNEKEI